MYLLGIDIGTSSCKAVLFRTNGSEVFSVTENYSVYYPHENYAEQDPNEWYAAVCAAVKKIISDGNINPHNISAVGVDGQSWSCIMTGKNGDVLANSPIWFDRRAADECEHLDRIIGSDNIFNLCGNPMQPTYTTPKVLWFKKNHPELYRNTYKILQSNSYIVYKLTGMFTQDKSQGYGHFFYDIRNNRYDKAMADSMGIDLSMFPDIYSCHEIVGKITSSASAETGLIAGTPVVAGGLDAAAGTLGVGVYLSGQTQEMSGTSGGMSICLSEVKAHKSLITCSHVIDGMNLLQGGTSGGGGSMKWFSEEFGRAFISTGDDEKSILREIDAHASKSAAGSKGVIFLPYMAGERSPIWDSNAKGMFFGLSYDTGKAEMARAVMEGVAFSLKHCLNTAEAAGAKCEILYPSGGAVKSDIWMQIKADITGKSFVVPHTSSATSLGAVMLAGIGVGIYRDAGDAVNQSVTFKKTYLPNSENAETYEKLYKKYLRLYENTKELMRI